MRFSALFHAVDKLGQLLQSGHRFRWRCGKHVVDVSAFALQTLAVLFALVMFVGGDVFHHRALQRRRFRIQPGPIQHSGSKSFHESVQSAMLFIKPLIEHLPIMSDAAAFTLNFQRRHELHDVCGIVFIDGKAALQINSICSRWGKNHTVVWRIVISPKCASPPRSRLMKQRARHGGKCPCCIGSDGCMFHIR